MKLTRLWTICAVAGLLSQSVWADTKFSGFADAQLGWAKQNSRGFTIYDGAVYVDSSMDSASFKLDLPFSGGGANNNFAFATGKAQAYFNHKMGSLSWQMGQFDHSYGYAGNDSVGYFHARQGALHTAAYNSIMTHTGLKLAYMFSDAFSFNVVVSDPNASGTIGTNNFEYGGQLVYNSSGTMFKAGYLFNKGALKNNTLLNVGAGTKMGAWDLNLDFALKDTTAQVDSSLGFAGDFIYNMTDSYGLGLRAEYLSKFTNYSQIDLTLGSKHKLTQNLTFKAGFNYQSATAVSGGTSASSYGLDLAGVYGF
ncbi:MAG: hypothetical protein AB7P04_06895 [Bacteriovoracia bacterium]